MVENARKSVLLDLPKILDSKLPARRLFDQTPAFMGRYFWLDDAVSEVDHHDRLTSGAWNKVTGGNTDEGSLLTLFLCVAAGASPKTLLTEKAATALVRKIQKSGLKQERVADYILDNAPVQYQDDYAGLWASFMDEARQILTSDSVHAHNDAMALLRREVNVKQA